jgi:uncharacterized protein with LGFP repeats
VQGGDFTVTVQSVTAAGAVVVVSPGTSPIGAKYVASGGAGGVLGAAVRAQVCGLRDGGCYRRYAGGSIYWSPSTPAAVVRGAIRDRWAALGYERGALGYPVADAGCGLRGGGCAQRFQHGAVYWSPASGAHPVTGALLTAWKARGAERGALGYPVADPRTSGRTTVQRFQHGTLSYASGAVRAS